MEQNNLHAFLGILFVCMTGMIKAQAVSPSIRTIKSNAYEQVYQVQGNFSISIDTQSAAFFVRLPEHETIPTLIWNQKELDLELQPHSLNGINDSELVFTERHAAILTGFAQVPIEIHLLNFSKSAGFTSRQKLSKSGDCSKPSMILGATWREGLNPPKQGRTPTEVQHIVIHHSAGSNSLNDWQEAVRAIYVYHTESNGWDDIGYNFLIDPNGVIYEGRESQGAADIDNIQGAHFCGKNSGTMGICLIGNYMSIPISDTMRKSLINLCAWKAIKDGIYPKGSSIHPSGGSSYLGHVVGHRDGCNTSCPGDQFYPTLDITLDSIQARYEACGGFVGTKEIGPNSISISPNPVESYFDIINLPIGATIMLFSSTGQRLSYRQVENRVHVNDLSRGFYTVLIRLPSGNTTILKVAKT